MVAVAWLAVVLAVWTSGCGEEDPGVRIVVHEPPTTPALPGSPTPMPARPACVSGPAGTTGTPSRKPSCRAAADFNVPATVPGWQEGGR